MATAEALKKVDDLKETGAGSLKDDEKELLNSLSKSDIEGKKAVLESKTFKIDGQPNPVSLPKIVRDMKISPDRTESTLYGKPIARKSELGAAIQLYVILHNKFVGKPLIDGKVGRFTNEGIADTQTDVKAERKEKAPQHGEKLDMRELENHNFTKEFNELKVRQEMEKLKVMDSDGYLNFVKDYSKGGAIVDNEGKITIKYISQVDKKEKTVKIGIKKDNNNQVDSKVIAEKISEAVKKAEKDLDIKTNNLGAEDGIESFKDKQITNPVIQKWAKIKGIKFECDKFDNGRIQIRAVSDGNNVLRIMKNNKDVLTTDGNFDSEKFNKILKDNCYYTAVAEVKTQISQTKGGIDSEKITRVSDADRVIKKYTDLVSEIDSYKDDTEKGFGKEKTATLKAKELAVTKKFCYEKLGEMDGDINSLKRMSKVLLKENKDKVEEIIKRHSKLEKDGAGKYNRVYKMFSKKEYSDKFISAGMNKDYQDRLREMRKIASNYEIDIHV